MTVLDSSVWVALFHESDSQHRKAVEAMRTVGSSLLVPEYVVLETCTVLTKLAGRSSSEQFLDRVMKNKDAQLYIGDTVFFEDVLAIYRTPLSPIWAALSFVDISLLVLSRSHRVVTFDEALRKVIAETWRGYSV